MPGERADDRAGIVAAAVFNAAGGLKGRALQPSEFAPDYDAELPDPEERSAGLLAKVEAINALMGGKDLREPKSDEPTEPQP